MCAGLDKTPGGTQVGTHGTAALNWDTGPEGSMTPVSVEVEGAGCSPVEVVQPV